MEIKVIIVHGSEIIQQGLYVIIKNLFDQESVLLKSTEELKNYQTINGAKILVLVDSQLDHDMISKTPLYKHNSLSIIMIRNNSEAKTCQENCDCCFNLSDSKSRIYDLLNPFLITKNNNSENTSSSLLTVREIEVVKLVAFGKTNKEIAEELFISIHTVISHRKNITEKLGIKSISGLTVYAMLNNLIDTSTLDPESLI